MAALVYRSCQNFLQNTFHLSPVTNSNAYRKKTIYLFISNHTNLSTQSTTKHHDSRFLTSINHPKFTNRVLNILPAPSFHRYGLITSVDIRRQFSTDGPVGSPKRSLPPLMEFPELVWPSLFKTIRNWILSTLIIPPYFDEEFSLLSFVKGSKHAVQVVSQILSDGNYKSLDGLVEEETIGMIQKSMADLSLAQRQQLAITKDDIYYSFPYQVGVMFDETNSAVQRRFVEITMVYHVLKGLSAMRTRGEEPPLSMGLMPEYRDKIYICNYRFIREFTKGVNDQWTINLVNHFKPSDFL